MFFHVNATYALPWGDKRLLSRAFVPKQNVRQPDRHPDTQGTYALIQCSSGAVAGVLKPWCSVGTLAKKDNA